MRPCDCKDRHQTKEYLNEQGISFNEFSITVLPSYVLIKAPLTTIRIPMIHFKKFAEWYLEDQEVINDNKTI